MKKSTFNTLLVGGGFLLGAAGIKLLTSAPVKNACVQGIACGMRIKNGYQDMVEQAKLMSTTWLPSCLHHPERGRCGQGSRVALLGTNHEILDY